VVRQANLRIQAPCIRITVSRIGVGTWGLGSGVEGFGFGGWGWRERSVQRPGLGHRVLGFEVSNFRIWVWGLGFRI